MKKKLAAKILTLILMHLLGEVAQGHEHPDELPSSAGAYRIQPTDVLEIFVWREPELSKKVFVRPDGRISVPLLQDMGAAGLTPAELKEEIENGLREYISSPNVTVIVDAIQHYTVYVIGKVQKPGSFTLGEPICILQALTLAGGFDEFASKSKITLVRSRGVEHELIRVNYDEIVGGKTGGKHILLQSGDVVVVP